MDHKLIVREIKANLGTLVRNVEFSESEGFLWMNRVPKMSMRALEKVVCPLGVFVVRDRDTELDVIINDGMSKDIISTFDL